MIFGSADAVYVAAIAAVSSVIVGLFGLVGAVVNARRSAAVKHAINGDLHDRLDRMEGNQDRIEGKVDGIIHELAGEKVRAQMAEAELSARLDLKEKPT